MLLGWLIITIGVGISSGYFLTWNVNLILFGVAFLISVYALHSTRNDGLGSIAGWIVSAFAFIFCASAGITMFFANAMYEGIDLSGILR